MLAFKTLISIVLFMDVVVVELCIMMDDYGLLFLLFLFDENELYCTGILQQACFFMTTDSMYLPITTVCPYVMSILEKFFNVSNKQQLQYS